MMPAARDDAVARWSASVTQDRITCRSCRCGTAVVTATFWTGICGAAAVAAVASGLVSACSLAWGSKRPDATHSPAAATSRTAITRLGLKKRDAIADSPDVSHEKIARPEIAVLI